jgi:hypothetical protein
MNKVPRLSELTMSRWALLVVASLLAQIDGIASNFGEANRKPAYPRGLALRKNPYASFSAKPWRIPNTPTLHGAMVLHLRGGGPRDEVLIDYSKDPISDSAKERATKLCQEAWAVHGEGEVLEAERLYNQALREVNTYILSLFRSYSAKFLSSI